MVPTSNQIAAQVEAILARDPDTRCIAIRSPAKDAWPETLSIAGRSFRLRWCPSSLAAREVLVETESGASDAARPADPPRGYRSGQRPDRPSLPGAGVPGGALGHGPPGFPGERDRLAAGQAELDGQCPAGLPAAGRLSAGGRAVFSTSIPPGDMCSNGALGIAEARPDLVSLLRWSLRRATGRALCPFGRACPIPGHGMAERLRGPGRQAGDGLRGSWQRAGCTAHRPGLQRRARPRKSRARRS